MVAVPPHEVPQPEHVLDELVQGGPSWRVVAGDRAMLRFCHLVHQPRAEDFHPLDTCGAPGGHPRLLVPGQGVARRLLYRLVVVRPEEPQVGAAHVHVCWGLFRATAEDARLHKDGDAGEPLLPDAEPALQRRVAVTGPQRPVVGGCPGEVPGVDVGRGVGRAQGCVSPVRQRMVKLCLLRDCAGRLHGGGPQVEVAVTAGDYELGLAGTRRPVLQDGVLGRRPV